MPLTNDYFTALEPFTVLRAVGSRPSNTWIGASRVVDTVYEETRVEAGEELHDLVGGLFHVDGEGRAHACRLTRPVHIFEAHYHRGAESARLAALIRDEIIAPEDDPRPVARYRAA